MRYDLDKNRPICPQITEIICAAIANGTLAKGEKLSSVRDIAVNAGVNPNTVQKALEQLEALGVIQTVRGSGSFVCEDTSIAKNALSQIIHDKTKQFFSQLNAFGLTDEQVKNIVKEWQYNE